MCWKHSETKTVRRRKNVVIATVRYVNKCPGKDTVCQSTLQITGHSTPNQYNMSLFKACTWWTSQCPDYEQNYDPCLLHCCRFGLENGEKDCIVVGSHSGYISIFQPIQVEGAGKAFNEFKPTDLLLEIKLPFAILEITSGTFLMYVHSTSNFHIDLF